MPNTWHATTIQFLTQPELRAFFRVITRKRDRDWVGHASIKNTVIYAQLTSRRRDEEARKVFASPYVV